MTDNTDITVVAVHGNGGGASRFARLPSPLADDVDLLAVTLPGFGDVPADPGLQSVPDYADRLASMLPQVGTTVLLGHGIGGSIALDLVSRRPHAVDGLILHAPVGAHLDTRLFPRLLTTNAARTLVKRAITAPLLRPLLHRVFFPTGIPEPHRSAFFDGYRRADAFAQMFDIITVGWFDGLTPIAATPTVLLWGENDRVLKAGHTEQFSVKAPHATTEIVKGWDHFPMLEQPGDYATVVARIARTLSGDRPTGE
ncbi:MAG: alpha/beta hydrolase [Actinomycetota bacterium]